jgi:general stress protein 26
MGKAPDILRGVNQRANVVMTPEEIDAFLHSQTQVTFCTHKSDGTIHAVAMAYGFLSDGTMAFEAKLKSQKIKNLLENAQLTVLAYDGEKYEELRGVQLVGHAEITDDPDVLMDLARSMYSRHFGPVENATQDELKQMIDKRVAAKLIVDRTISWDHRKLIKPSNSSS